MIRILAIGLAFGVLVSSAAIGQTPPPASKSDAQPVAGAPTAMSPGAAVPAPAAPPATTSAPASSKSSDGMEGLAAVYSDKLAGRKTASGEIFNQSKLTAAHRSLAFGTLVKVTNMNNNKTVEVRINDRGPPQAGRVIDMTSAAAAKIGVGKKSMAPVQLEVVAEAPARKAKK